MQESPIADQLNLRNTLNSKLVNNSKFAILTSILLNNKKVNKESYFYIQEIYDDEKLIGYKFGITNNTPKQRMKKQSYHTNYTQKILFSIIGDGMFIYNLEKYIKMQFKEHKLSKSEFGDGYTETISSELIELLEDEIINFILTN